MHRNRDTRVTIVVPTYRRPAYLAQCLASIRAQTYNDFIVVVYDNSPDREGQAVVEEVADIRFSYVPRPQNIGMFGNAVQGLAAARTELVMEVDDDDLLLPECLATLVPAFDGAMDVSIAFGRANIVDDVGRRMSPEESARYIAPRADLPVGFIHPFVNLAAAGLVFLNAGVIRHDAIDWERVPKQAGTAYDRYIALAAARNGLAAFHTPTPVIDYRVHTTSDTVVNSPEQHYGALYVLSAERLRTRAEDRVWIEAEALRTRLFLAKSLADVGESRDAWRQLFDALKRPEFPHAMCSLVRTYGAPHVRRMANKFSAVVEERLNHS